MLTLEDKSNYVVHYKNLQFYLRHGMRLKRVHWVIQFDQEPWMEPYIYFNTEFRKEAKSKEHAAAVQALCSSLPLSLGQAGFLNEW